VRADVQGYRLYYLDPNGHVRHAVEIACDGDERALEAVEQHRDGRAMELWQQARRVMIFPAAPAGRPPEVLS
jgi:hypothetical protein